MKVSILIPTLNRKHFLEDAVDSARRQSHHDLEILISDNGSTDGTQTWAEQMGRRDPRVRLLPRNPNPGMFENINHLLAHARGDLFGVLSDDDRLLPEFVTSQLSSLTEYPGVGMVFCDHWIIDRSGVRLHESTEDNSAFFGRADLPRGVLDHPITRALQGVVSLNFSLYRADFFQNERFDVACGGAADLDFALRAAQRVPIVYVTERLGEYRVHGANATSKRPDFMIDGTITALSKHVFSDPKAEIQRRVLLREQQLIKSYHKVGLNHAEGRHALNAYFSLGGSQRNVKAITSAVLLRLPAFGARMVKKLLSPLRQVRPLHQICRAR
jgi:glycosyltransferase involved in cell wall biosynthesis